MPSAPRVATGLRAHLPPYSEMQSPKYAEFVMVSGILSQMP